MSDTNRVGLRIQKSSATTFPVTLSPNQLTPLRITGTPSLAFLPQTVTSNEIRPDRQVSDLIAVGAEAGGDVGFELSFGTFDDLIESGLFSTWTNTPERQGATQITGTGAGTVDLDTSVDFKVDHIVRIADTGGTNLGEGVYIVTANAADTLTLTPFNVDTNAVDGAVTINADSLIKVVGYHTNADGDFTTTVTNGVVSLADDNLGFGDLMGAGAELVAGQWVKVSGFSGPNSVWARLTSVADGILTFAQADGVVAESPVGAAQIWFGDYVINGSEDISDHEYLIERRFQDHNPITREAFIGMAVNNFNIQLEPQSIATGTATFFGRDAEVSDDVANSYDDLYAVGLPTDLPASTSNVYNTSSNVGRVGRGDSEVDSGNRNFVSQASIEINNNLRRIPGVGIFGAAAVGVGEFSVTGSLNAQFDDRSLLDAVLNSSDTSFDITLVSNDKRTMTFDMPRIRFSDGAPQVPGKNQDVTINLTYQALLDATLNYTLLVQRGFYSV